MRNIRFAYSLSLNYVNVNRSNYVKIIHRNYSQVEMKLMLHWSWNLKNGKAGDVQKERAQ